MLTSYCLFMLTSDSLLSAQFILIATLMFSARLEPVTEYMTSHIKTVRLPYLSYTYNVMSYVTSRAPIPIHLTYLERKTHLVT